jgi:hypothetical protein
LQKTRVVDNLKYKAIIMMNPADEESQLPIEYTAMPPVASLEPEVGITPKLRRGLEAASCMKDSLKVGAAVGATIGFASTAIIGGLLCAPSILCNKDKENKMEHIKEGAKITGVFGACVGGFVGLKVGCVAGVVSAPFAYFFGKPKVCTDLGNKVDEQVIRLVQNDRPQPQVMA